MNDIINLAAAKAAEAIRFNLPLDAFGQDQRLNEYASIWANAVAKKLAADGLLATEPKGEASPLEATVTRFLAEREQVINAINNCPATNMDDYWRWQGNAEARRVLKQDLEKAGIDLGVKA